METNVVYHLDFLRNKLPDHCANLIIADPPYFEVKGDFDFVFKDFDEYLKHVEAWAKECARILAENGTLIWWGDYRRIAYAQIILDKYFNLLTNGVWVKINGQTVRNKWEDARCLVNNTERFLVYETKTTPGVNRGFCSPNAGDFFEGYEPLRQWLRAEYKSLGGVEHIIRQTGNSVFSHHTSRSQWSFPSPKNVEELLPLYAAKYVDIEESANRLRTNVRNTKSIAKSMKPNADPILANSIKCAALSHSTKKATLHAPTISRRRSRQHSRANSSKQ